MHDEAGSQTQNLEATPAKGPATSVDHRPPPPDADSVASPLLRVGMVVVLCAQMLRMENPHQRLDGDSIEVRLAMAKLDDAAKLIKQVCSFSCGPLVDGRDRRSCRSSSISAIRTSPRTSSSRKRLLRMPMAVGLPACMLKLDHACSCCLHAAQTWSSPWSALFRA